MNGIELKLIPLLGQQKQGSVKISSMEKPKRFYDEEFTRMDVALHVS